MILERQILEDDDPARALLHFAHEHGFDLVVGHHDQGRAGRILFGGLSQRLVANPRVPVLVIGEENGGST